MSKKFKFKIKSDMDVIPKSKEETRIVRVCVTAPGISDDFERGSINLGLVIDRSGSMNGEKIRNVVKAAKLIVDQLNSNDTVSIISYNEVVHPHFEAIPCTEANKDLIASILYEIQAGGMTNLSGGWLRGCESIAKADNGHINHAFLMTDGLANVGITDLEELGQHSSELAKRGIRTSTFGVGLQFNEFLLTEIANRGQGVYRYIKSPEHILDAFANDFDDLMNITAKNTVLEIVVPDGLEMSIPGGWEMEEDGNLHKVLLGNFAANEKRCIFLELGIPTESSVNELKFALSWEDINGDEHSIEKEVEFLKVSAAKYKEARKNAAVIKQYSKIKVGSISTHALKYYRDGDEKGAKDYIRTSLEQSRGRLSNEGISGLQDFTHRMDAKPSRGDVKQMQDTSYRTMRSMPLDKRSKLQKCQHGVPKIKTCAICDPEKFKRENG
ncbi:MAG: VWA domain-containing protein [Bacteroidota bacterium]